MKPKVYKVKAEDIKEIKVGLQFIPFTAYHQEIGNTHLYNDVYVDVLSLPNGTILRTTDFITMKNNNGEIVRNLGGINYIAMDNVLLTQDENKRLELVSSNIEDIKGIFDEIDIPTDEDYEEPEDEDDEEDEDDDGDENLDRDLEDSDEDYAMLQEHDIEDIKDEKPEPENEEEEHEDDEAEDEERGPIRPFDEESAEDESDDDGSEPEPEEADEAESEDDEEDNPFSKEYFEEVKKRDERKENSRKELERQISEQQAKLVPANKKHLSNNKPTEPAEEETPKRPPQNKDLEERRKEYFQKNKQKNNKRNKQKFVNKNNSDVEIVKAPGIFDDPLRAELFAKLRED